MKYLFLLGLLAFVGALVYWRLRPYIRTVRRIFGAVRDVRRMSVGQQERPNLSRQQSRDDRRGAAPTEKLVRCAACGTWIPASRAVSLQRSSENSYCSHACLERAADAPPRRTHKSAS